MELKHTMPEIQGDDTDNPSAVEAAAACALSNTDITLLHPNEVQQVMNKAQAVSDYEDDNDFDENDIIFHIIINEAKNTKIQFDAKEALEEKEVNKNNNCFEDGNDSYGDE